MSNSLYKTFILFILGQLVNGVLAPIYAEVSTESVVELSDDITVIGDHSEEHGLIDAPVKVEVLGKSYFKDQQYQDLSEGVSDIAGVSTSNSQRRAGSKSALIQGFGENSVLVMIDGTPVSQNGSFGFDLTQISANDIEKVEVIKGAASALYGSQAMGGVINIVTKKPSSKGVATAELSQVETLEGVGGQARNGSLTLSGRNKLGGAKLSLSYRDQEALDLDPTSIAQDDVEYQRYQGSLFLDKKIGKLKVFSQYLYMGGVITSTASKPYSSSAFGASVNQTDSKTHNFKVGVESKLERGSLSAIVNYEKSSDELVLNDRPATPYPETFKETSFNAKRIDILLKEAEYGGHEVSAGILIRQEEVSQDTTTQAIESIIVKTKDIDQRRIGSYEAFVQDTILWGNLEVSPGLRHQVDSNFGSFTAPKVNISHYFDQPNFSLKSWLSVGTGYRAPSVKERFFTLDHTSVANYIVVGNENLSPEKSLSFQVGEELRLSNRFSLHANLFLNKVQGLIESVELESSQSNRVFSYVNLDEVLSRGVEVAAKFKFGNWGNLSTNYSYTEVINRETNLLLANRPLYNALLTLKITPTNQLDLIALTRFTGAKFIEEGESVTSPGFSTTDFKVNYKLKKGLTIFSSVRNIFNSVKEANFDSVTPLVDDRPSRGQEVFAGLKMELL